MVMKNAALSLQDAEAVIAKELASVDEHESFMKSLSEWIESVSGELPEDVKGSANQVYAYLKDEGYVENSSEDSIDSLEELTKQVPKRTLLTALGDAMKSAFGPVDKTKSGNSPEDKRERRKTRRQAMNFKDEDMGKDALYTLLRSILDSEDTSKMDMDGMEDMPKKKFPRARKSDGVIGYVQKQDGERVPVYGEPETLDPREFLKGVIQESWGDFQELAEEIIESKGSLVSKGEMLDSLVQDFRSHVTSEFEEFKKMCGPGHMGSKKKGMMDKMGRRMMRRSAGG